MKYNKYFWVIGGGQLQVPLIKVVKDLNYKIIVTDKNPNCICNTIADRFYEIDIFNVKKHIELADSLKKKLTIKGVLAAGVDAPFTMAKLAEHLQLPTVSSRIANIVHNKDLFRLKMKEAGIPTPRFKVLRNDKINSLKSIVEEFGFPLIIKNTSSSGSRGTKIFYDYNKNEIENTVKKAISVSKSNKALIEEVWEGSEHTVETLFDIEGKFHKCFITDRLFDKSKGFPLETGLVHPTTLSQSKQKKLYGIAENVSRILGIKIGAAKFDFMYTDEGPRIIEMTVRLSGGFDCQYVVPIATGKEILKAAALTALGKRFDKKLLLPKIKKHVVTKSLWPMPGKIIDINNIDLIKKMDGFENIFFRYKIGDIVEPYIDCTNRTSFIIVSGNTLNHAKQNMDYILEKIKIITI